MRVHYEGAWAEAVFLAQLAFLQLLPNDEGSKQWFRPISPSVRWPLSSIFPPMLAAYTAPYAEQAARVCVRFVRYALFISTAAVLTSLF